MGAFENLKQLAAQHHVSVQAQLDQRKFEKAAVPDLSLRLGDNAAPLREKTSPSEDRELFGLMAGESEGNGAWEEEGDTASLREVIEEIFSRTGKMSDLFDGIKVKGESVKNSVGLKENFISVVRDIAMEKMGIRKGTDAYKNLESELSKLGEFYGILYQVKNLDKEYQSPEQNSGPNNLREEAPSQEQGSKSNNDGEFRTRSGAVSGRRP